jgi:hypothetical protein
MSAIQRDTGQWSKNDEIRASRGFRVTSFCDSLFWVKIHNPFNTVFVSKTTKI